MNEIKKYFKEPLAKKMIIVILLLIVLFLPALRGMFDVWMQDSNNSHGMLVPLIVLYLIFDILKHSKEKLRNATSTKLTWLGGICLFSAIMLYFFGILSDIVVFKNIAFVLALQSSVLFLCGINIFKIFIFPLLFLFFMIPIPGTLYGMVALPMQLFATKVSVFLLEFSPLPVSSDGNIIRIGNEMLTVAEACSGLRSLMSFIMLSILFAYLAKSNYLKKGLLVLISIPVALCGNIIRILILAVVAYIYSAKVAVHLIHDVSGYFMFIAAFLFFFWLAKKIEN